MLALEGIDLTLDVGEVHCIVGENGSGKSTLIKIICRHHAPSPRAGGSSLRARVPAASLPPSSTACGVQVIYQDLSLFPNLTVAENIGMAQHLGALHAVNWAGDQRRRARGAGEARRVAGP